MQPTFRTNVVAFVIASPPFLTAATFHVPADYPTIQACIDAAVSGQDECVVAPATYNETINFLGKAIALRSSHGAEVTIIDATGIGGSVVTCATGEGPDTVLDGFTITGGNGTDLGDGLTVGGGMFNQNSSPTVTNCTFSGNNTGPYIGDGGGMYNGSSSPAVTNCTFSKNSGRYGGGMFNIDSNPTVINCTFSENTARGANYGGGGCRAFTVRPR